MRNSLILSCGIDVDADELSNGGVAATGINATQDG